MMKMMMFMLCSRHTFTGIALIPTPTLWWKDCCAHFTGDKIEGHRG